MGGPVQDRDWLADRQAIYQCYLSFVATLQSRFHKAKQSDGCKGELKAHQKVGVLTCSINMNEKIGDGCT